MTDIATVFAGYDDGHFALPAELLAARAAVGRLEFKPAPQHPLDAREAFLSRVVEAATNDAPAPDVADYLAAERRHTEWVLLSELTAEAVQIAQARLRAGDTVLTEHLRPAMAQLEKDLRTVAALLPEDASDRLMAQPGITEKARKAWRDLDLIHQRYTAIRAAQLVATGPGQDEDEGEWSAYDNFAELWPEWANRSLIGNRVTPPWPQEPSQGRERLLWLSRHGARFVVLTRAERTARWHAKYGAQFEERRRLHQAAQSTSGFLG